MTCCAFISSGIRARVALFSPRSDRSNTTQWSYDPLVLWPINHTAYDPLALCPVGPTVWNYFPNILLLLRPTGPTAHWSYDPLVPLEPMFCASNWFYDPSVLHVRINCPMGHWSYTSESKYCTAHSLCDPFALHRAHWSNEQIFRNLLVPAHPRSCKVMGRTAFWTIRIGPTNLAIQLFVQQFDYADNKENTKVPNHCPFVRGLHRLPVDSPRIKPTRPLRWRHNDHDSVSNHQPHGCLLNRLFRRRSKKTSKLRVTGLCVGNSPGPVNSPHKGPVTRKMFPFDDVIMRKTSPCHNVIISDYDLLIGVSQRKLNQCDQSVLKLLP